MASAVTHAVVGLCAGLAFYGGKKPVRLCVLSAVCAAAPDADVLAFPVGIPYGSFWAHRGFLHSLSFAALLSLFVARVFFAGGMVLSHAPGSCRSFSFWS